MVPNNRRHYHTELSVLRIHVSIRDSSTNNKIPNTKIRIMFMLLMVLLRRLIAPSLREAYALMRLNYHIIMCQRKAKVDLWLSVMPQLVFTKSENSLKSIRFKPYSVFKLMRKSDREIFLNSKLKRNSELLESSTRDIQFPTMSNSTTSKGFLRHLTSYAN